MDNVISEGLRKDLANYPQPNLSDVRAISFVFQKDVRAADISRHGDQVTMVELYTLQFPAAKRFLVVYFNDKGLVTDEDVVDKL